MSNVSLTSNEFLRLGKEEIEDIFEDTLPQSKGKAYFRPSLYSPLTNPILGEMKSWKLAYVAKAAERKSILNFAVPILLIGPGLISIIMGGFTHLTAILFSGCTVVIVAFMWFFGRIWAWETKHYGENVEFAEKAVEKTRNRRAREWAEYRYDMNTAYIEWAEFSDFYIEGTAYRWKETEDGKYIIVEVETGQEPPLLESAA